MSPWGGSAGVMSTPQGREGRLSVVLLEAGINGVH